MKSISVIIPNYNGEKLLEHNLPFVYQALKTSSILDFEIIISDDASQDDSIGFLRKNYPDIKLITNTENKGFASNINRGIRAASKDLLMLLNSDVQLTAHYFEPLMTYFEQADTFGVMGRIIGLDSDQIQDGAKYPVLSFGNIVTTNRIAGDNATLYTLFLSGANALVDRNKTMELGGFNELFDPYYAEDVDLCIRAWRLGYKLYYEHKAVCRHPNSATIKKQPSKKVKVISKRNKMFLHYLHLDGTYLYYFMVLLCFKAFFRTLVGDFNYFNSFKMFLKSLDKLRACRRLLKKAQNQKQIIIGYTDIVRQIQANNQHYTLERI